MKAEKKKMNSYAKYILLLGVSACIGAAIGISILVFDVQQFGTGIGRIMHMIRGNLMWILLIITVVSVAYGEIVLRRMQTLARLIPDAEDEEGDRLEYELEAAGSAGLIASNIFSVLAILVLSAGYSLTYIDSMSKKGIAPLMAAFVIFILHNSYEGFWQMRYVKTVQRAFPTQKGDPASRKFRQQWLESCDEEERTTIYQGAYKAYRTVSSLMPTLAVVTMLTHLIWNTGVMAVFMVGFIWIVLTCSYCRFCTKKRRQQISRRESGEQ